MSSFFFLHGFYSPGAGSTCIGDETVKLVKIGELHVLLVVYTHTHTTTNKNNHKTTYTQRLYFINKQVVYLIGAPRRSAICSDLATPTTGLCSIVGGQDIRSEFPIVLDALMLNEQTLITKLG
jgi:hypothetical protein